MTSSPITYGQLKAAQPELYSQSADQFQQIVTAFEQASVDLNQRVYQPIEYSWTGSAATAALSAIGGSVADYTATLDYLDRFVGLLRSAAEGIGEAQAYLRAAETIATNNGWTIGEDGNAQPILPTTVRNRSIVEQSWQAMSANPECAEMQDLIQRALATAQAVDDQISAALTSPEQFGRGKGWQADVAKLEAAAAATAAKLERSGIPGKGTSPAEVGAWWKAMSPSTQVQLIKDQPALIGALNGLPSMVRDKANRIVLADDIKADKDKIAALTTQEQQLQAEILQMQETGTGEGHGRITALASTAPLDRLEKQLADIQTQLGSISSQRDALEGLQSQLNQGGTQIPFGRVGQTAAIPPLYLLGFDTNDAGHAIVAVGNPDTAKNVCVYVPGLNTSSNSAHFSADIQHTENMAIQANLDSGAQNTSAILWLGYNAPQIKNLAVAGTGDATDAVPALTSFLGSLRSVNSEINNLTLLGHSYGSVVVGETAKASHLPVNNIVLLGSPGVEVNSASGLNIDPSHVWAGAAADDIVSTLGYFGLPPTYSGFGAHIFDVNSNGNDVVGLKEHGEYFDQSNNTNNNTGTSSLQNIGAIISGHYDQVTPGKPTNPQVSPPVGKVK